MVATLESFRKLQKPLFFILPSILLLGVYYARNTQPTPYVTLKQQRVVDGNRLRTVIGLQSHPDPAQRNCTLHEPRNFSTRGWQPLGGDSYLYSAHLDDRRGPLSIRIVALLRGDPADEPLFCRTWPDGSLSRIEKTELWVRTWDFAERGRYLHPYLLTCAIPVAVKSVSVVGDPCEAPTNLLNVPPQRQDEEKKDFAICVKPMDYSADITHRLLEWLEFQFLVGVDSVLAYVHSVHANTRRLLDSYGGRVTAVRHSPPTAAGGWKNDTWQRRRLEVALYNDCFYRHAASHRFVVNLDLDEAIVPLAPQDSWSGLLEQDPNAAESASVSARNVYFFDALGVDPSVPRQFHMLRHVYRSAHFTPPGFAQKSFFNTLHAEAVAHHFALRAIPRPGGVRLMSGLDAGRARLHHYRCRCPPLMERQCEEDFMRYRVRDDAIWRFRGPLESAVASKRRMLGLDGD